MDPCDLVISRFGDFVIFTSPDHQINKSLASRSRGTPRRPVVFFAADARRQPCALVEPHLHADAAGGRERLREAVVDVRAERLERQLPVQVPLGALSLIHISEPTRLGMISY